MRKIRLNCYFAPALANQLAVLAAQQGVPRAQLVETAVASHLSPDARERREAAYVRRLDRQSSQLERVERYLIALIEGHARFIQIWLTTMVPPAPSAQAAARAQGAARFDDYLDDVNALLERGGIFLREIVAEIRVESWSTAADGDGPRDRANG